MTTTPGTPTEQNTFENEAVPESTVDVVTFGETLALLRANRVGPLAHNDRFTMGIGGAESNVAIGLSRLGWDALWTGRVGDDNLGRMVTRVIRGEGVECRSLTDPAASTGLMLKTSRLPGRSEVVYFRDGSAGSRISIADLPMQRIASARILHVSGITPALSESARVATFAAVAAAKSNGVAVSLDLNFRSQLWTTSEASRVLSELVGWSDIVFADPAEADLVTSAGSDIAMLEKLVEMGPSQAVLKLGDRGAMAIAGAEMLCMPAMTTDVVDTVGAGDGFVAGYLAGILANLDLGSSLRQALGGGAFACSDVGDWEGGPTTGELELLSLREPVTR